MPTTKLKLGRDRFSLDLQTNDDGALAVVSAIWMPVAFLAVAGALLPLYLLLC